MERNTIDQEPNALFITEAITGETGILRNIRGKEELWKIPEEHNTILKIFERAVQKWPLNTFKVVDNEEKTCTFLNVQKSAKAYSNYITKENLVTKVHLDNKDWKFMGIYSKNCPEWIISYMGNIYNNITTVSIYDTFGLDGIDYILNTTKLETIVMQALFLDRIANLHKQGKSNNLKNLIVIDLENNMHKIEEHYKYLISNGFTFFSMDTVTSANSDRVDFEICKPESIVLISFTSGSMGVPKGALVSHECLATAGIAKLNSINLPFQEGDVHFSYLPYSHIVEHLYLNFSLYIGLNIIYSSGDARNIEGDIKIAQPSFLTMVPRILLRLYDSVNMKIKSYTGIKKLLVDIALKEKLTLLETQKKYDHFIFDPLVFDPIKQAIIGKTKINFIITASAPIDSKILDFFKVVFGCPVLEAYGMTEIGPVSTSDSRDIRSGNIGITLPSCEIKLVDVPELDYYTTDKDENGVLTPRGEVWIRGNTTFKGYLCRDVETTEMLDKDGWVHSGDIGVILSGNRLKIVDRRKNIFKLSQGEYIAPEKIENIIKLVPYIIQNYIYGKSNNHYIVCLVIVEPATLIKLAEANNITPCSPEELLKSSEVHRIILNDIKQVCRKANLLGFEIPQKLLLTYDQFTIQNGMLTVTLKAMRTGVRKNWQSKLNELYV